MSEISNIGMSNVYATTYRASNAAAPSGGRHQSTDRVGESDPVEFSRVGRLLATEALEASSLRQAKIQALRAQIADGTFETHERLMGTVDRLIQELE